VAAFSPRVKMSCSATEVDNENGDSFPPSSDKRSLESSVKDHVYS